MGVMKTTVEIPDPLFRQVKAAAAERGVSLKVFFSEALRMRLRGQTPEAPWQKAFGGLRDLHRENLRLERIVTGEFERIDEEEWR